MHTTHKQRAMRRPATATLVHHAVPKKHQPQQRPAYVRIIYALLIGWWITIYWAIIGFILDECRIPLGEKMLSQLSTVFCLERRQ